jgi:hypothetical protein
MESFQIDERSNNDYTIAEHQSPVHLRRPRTLLEQSRTKICAEQKSLEFHTWCFEEDSANSSIPIDFTLLCTSHDDLLSEAQPVDL